MKNDNNKYVGESKKEQLIEDMMERMEKLRLALHQLDGDKRIKVVRKTISSEAKNGIVIAAYTDENGSLMDSVVSGKGEVSNILFMMTAATLNILNECDVSLENYIHMLQLFSEESKK